MSKILVVSAILSTLVAASCSKKNTAVPLSTVTVTSSPIQDVDIYLDDALIGKHTPIVKDVAVGTHVLVARAPDYRPKAYRFDLTSDEPATVEFKLEPATAAVPAADAPTKANPANP